MIGIQIPIIAFMSTPPLVVLCSKKSKIGPADLNKFSHPGFSALAYGKVAKEWFFILGSWAHSREQKSGTWENEAAMEEIFTKYVTKYVSQSSLLKLIGAWERFSGDKDADACDSNSTLAPFIAGLYLNVVAGNVSAQDEDGNSFRIIRIAEGKNLVDIKLLKVRGQARTGAGMTFSLDFPLSFVKFSSAKADETVQRE